MPWCPKCKTEYILGIQQCADCHIPLVDELEKKAAPGNKQRPSKDAGNRNGLFFRHRIRL